MEKISNNPYKKMFDCYCSYLNEQDCIDLSADVMQIVTESTKYLPLLTAWTNDEPIKQDILVNGFSLINLANQLNPDIPNIPVAILILWLEEQKDETYHGLASVASQKCVANPRIINGELCKFAILSDNTWYYMLDHQSEEELNEYQAWQVLLLNPGLIIQTVYDYPNNTVISLQEDGTYVVSMGE